MATIRARKQADGSTRYTAIVRIRRGKVIVYQEYKTFALRTAASSWARHREVALEQPGALTRVQQGTPTLAELIRWYIETFETISKWQRSKQAHLEFLERHALGKSNALTLTSAELIDHVRSRRAQGAGPATVANDLIWTGVVLRAAKSVKALPVRPEIVQEARDACGELRLTEKARKRTRRRQRNSASCASTLRAVISVPAFRCRVSWSLPLTPPALKAAASKVLSATWQRCRVHFLRNTLAHAGKGQRQMVLAAINTAFTQESFETASQQWRAVADQLRAKFPKLADLVGEAEADVLAFMSFPKAHRTQIHSTNPLERLNAEIKRRTDVVGIFPN
jgi:hypothetical protein